VGGRSAGAVRRVTAGRLRHPGVCAGESAGSSMTWPIWLPLSSWCWAAAPRRSWSAAPSGGNCATRPGRAGPPPSRN